MPQAARHPVSAYLHRNHRKNGLRQREPQRDGAERLACIKELARRCGQRSMHHQSLAAEAQKVKPDAQHPRRLCAGNQQAGREQQRVTASVKRRVVV